MKTLTVADETVALIRHALRSKVNELDDKIRTVDERKQPILLHDLRAARSRYRKAYYDLNAGCIRNC